MSAPESGYKFGTKNQWRRWLWNRIAERVQDRRGAIVAYLAGPDDLDRLEAMRRGFVANNMIAVDRDARLVKEHRASGALAVRGDILDFLVAWSQTRPLGVAVVDLCCGLERRVVQDLVFIPFDRPAFFGTVFALNVMRGRDPSGTEIRRESLTLSVQRAFLAGLDEKHRGAAFASALVAYHLREVVKRTGRPADDAHFTRIADSLGQRLRFAFYSYRSSSGQVFDSVVWQSPAVPKLIVERTGEERANRVGADRPEKTRPLSRRIAATLAHRSMRRG